MAKDDEPGALATGVDGMKPVVIGGIFLGALAMILWVGVESASIPVFKIRTLLADRPTGPVRIDDGKIAEIESLSPLRFKVAPKGDTQNFIWVESPRTVPENFKPDVDVGLEGELDAQTGVFHAYRISTQCPSKYEASKDGAKDGGYPEGANLDRAPSGAEVLGTEATSALE